LRIKTPRHQLSKGRNVLEQGRNKRIHFILRDKSVEDCHDKGPGGESLAYVRMKEKNVPQRSNEGE